MPLAISDSLAGLTGFLAYFGVSLVFFIAFCILYVRITPYAEYRLIRAGKIAPAISFSGAILGFVIPLASAVSHSVSLLDMLVWGLVAFVVQIVVFLVAQKIFTSLEEDMVNDRIASGIGLAVCLVIVWYTLKVIADTREIGAMVMKSLVFPEWWLFVSVPLSFGLMAIECVRRLLRPGPHAAVSSDSLHYGE